STKVAADQLDTVRACLKPIRERLLDVMLPNKSVPPIYLPNCIITGPGMVVCDGHRASFPQGSPGPLPLHPSPSPTPNQNLLPLSDVDAALNKLIEGNIAFDAPDRATIGKSKIVEARLSVTETPTALMSELTGSGRRESAALRVSDKMAATL